MEAIKSLTRFFLLATLVVIAGGCARLSPIPEKIEPEAAAVLDLMRSNNAQIQSLQGQGHLKIIHEGKAQFFRAAWLANHPDQFRFDIVSPWGQPTATFAFNKKDLFFYLYSQDRLYEGDATASSLSRFIPVKITPEELLKVLSGSVPIVPFRQAQLQSGVSEGVVLTLIGRWGNIVEKVWMKVAPFTVLRADYFKNKGVLTYSIVFDNFQYRESTVIPHVIAISGKDNAQWILTITKYAINIPTSEESFKLDVIRTDKE